MHLPRWGGSQGVRGVKMAAGGPKLSAPPPRLGHACQGPVTDGAWVLVCGLERGGEAGAVWRVEVKGQAHGLCHLTHTSCLPFFHLSAPPPDIQRRECRKKPKLISLCLIHFVLFNVEDKIRILICLNETLSKEFEKENLCILIFFLNKSSVCIKQISLKMRKIKLSNCSDLFQTFFNNSLVFDKDESLKLKSK